MCGTDTDCGCAPPSLKEIIVQYFKPFSTLLVGIAVGYWVVPKVITKVRP
jgi:hypothetical protein